MTTEDPITEARRLLEMWDNDGWFNRPGPWLLRALLDRLEAAERELDAPAGCDAMTTDYKPMSAAEWGDIDNLMVWEGNEPWHLVDAINSLYAEAKHWRHRMETAQASNQGRGRAGHKIT